MKYHTQRPLPPLYGKSIGIYRLGRVGVDHHIMWVSTRTHIINVVVCTKPLNMKEYYIILIMLNMESSNTGCLYQYSEETLKRLLDYLKSK